MKSTYKALRKVIIFIVGIFVVLLGLILIPLPGPGLPVVVLGLIILSTEFDWAKKHLETTKKKLSEFYKKIKKPGDKNKPT